MPDQQKKIEATPAVFQVEKPSLPVFFITVGVVLAIMGATLGTQAVTNMRTGSGKVVNEPREVDTFSKLVAAGNITVKLSKGESESVSVSAEDNVVGDVKVEVSDGTLTVSHGDDLSLLSARPTKDVVVNIVVKSLSSITNDGSVTMSGKNIPSQDLSITQNSSKNLNLGVGAKKLTVVLSGSGSATLTGSAESGKVTVNGSGTINTKELATPTVSATVSGSGNILTNASNALTVNITGSGNVEYLGNPPTVTKKISGSGKLKKL